MYKKIFFSLCFSLGFSSLAFSATEYFLMEGRVYNLAPFEDYAPAFSALSGQDVEFYFSINSADSNLLPSPGNSHAFTVNYLGGDLSFGGTVSGFTQNTVEGPFSRFSFGAGIPQLGKFYDGFDCNCGIDSWSVGAQLNISDQGFSVGTLTLTARQFTPVPFTPIIGVFSIVTSLSTPYKSNHSDALPHARCLRR